MRERDTDRQTDGQLGKKNQQILSRSVDMPFWRWCVEISYNYTYI